MTSVQISSIILPPTSTTGFYWSQLHALTQVARSYVLLLIYNIMALHCWLNKEWCNGLQLGQTRYNYT